MAEAGSWEKIRELRPHDVLVLDTRALLATHADRVLLTTMNTGAVSRFPSCPRRGRDTFMTVADFPHGVVEPAVEGGVRDVADLVERVERRRGADLGEVVWRSRPQQGPRPEEAD